MSEVLLRLKNIGVSYRPNKMFGKRHCVLQDVSFDIMKGETLGVIGKNGAGKSSLMKVLARIINPDEGEISGIVNRVQLLSLQVGFVPELSGRENAILSSLLLGLRKKEIIEKMEQIVLFSGLGDAIDDPIKTYSSGMRARLGFSVSCQADPDLLLIDEALGVGDKDFRQKSRDVIVQRMKSDKSFVLVSHNEATVLEYCQRVIWIENGRVVMSGDAGTVIGEYQKAL